MDSKLISGLDNVSGQAVPPGQTSKGRRRGPKSRENVDMRPVPEGLDEARHLQQAAEQLQSELLGSISHELRSPLAVIKGYTATLLRYADLLEEAERKEFLEAIKIACERLETMVNQLLEMSQLETGMLVPAFMAVNAEQLVREATGAFAEKLEQRGSGEHRLRLRILDSGSLPLVRADPRLLRDAVDALLENALRYSPDGGAIDVTIQVMAPPGIAASEVTEAVATPSPTPVVIAVEDTGIGIPADHLDRVFDRFHRVDAGLRRQSSGLGLGLSICKRIMELHGGAIWAESQLDSGSTFFLALPIAELEDDVPAV